MRQLAVAVAALLVALSASAATPPAETLVRLDRAIQLLESDDFAGTYTLTTRSVVAKPGGRDPEATEVVMASCNSPYEEIPKSTPSSSASSVAIIQSGRAVPAVVIFCATSLTRPSQLVVVPTFSP